MKLTKQLFIFDMDGILYFEAGDSTNGKELWKHDPVNGTSLVADIASGTSSSNLRYLTPMNGVFYFKAYDVTH